MIACGLVGFAPFGNTLLTDTTAWDLVTNQVTVYSSSGEYGHYGCPIPGGIPMMQERITDYQVSITIAKLLLIDLVT